MGDALGRIALQSSEGSAPEMETMMGKGEVEDAAPEQTCPKCGTRFPTQTTEGGELEPSQQQDLKNWFESNRPGAQMKGAMR